MSKLKLKIDSTCLGDSHCILKWYNKVVEGYQEKKMNAAMLYGVGVHKFIETMFKTKGEFPVAIAKSQEVFLRIPCQVDDKKPWLRDVNHLRSTCYAVWSMQVMEEKVFEIVSLPNGEPAVEQTFSILWYEDEFVEIYLEGTIDSVGKFVNGAYAIRDWKTSSSWDTRSYFTQYERTRQLPIYTIACKRMTRDFPDSVLGKIGAQKMGAFIDAIFVQKDLNGTSFGRSPIFQYTDEYLDKVSLLIDMQCKKLSDAVRTGFLPQEGLINGTCMHALYGKQCCFWNVCKSNEMVGKICLERDFVKKTFSPLEYNS